MTNLFKKSTLRLGSFFILFLFLTGGVFAQQTRITGKVLERQTENPLPGAHVYWLNTGKVTVTDQNGSFQMTGEVSGKQKLKITFLGYEVRYMTLSTGSVKNISVYLKPSEMSMKPVTVLARRTDDIPRARKNVYSAVNPSHDAGQFLRDVPNISGIRKGGGFGLDPVVRGFQKNQLQVQLDGVLQSQGACPNRMDPPTAHIQIENVSQVEVLKGPYALKYGPSFGGVINFQTKDTDFQSEPAYMGYATVGYESNIGRQRYSGGLTRAGENWITRLHLARTATSDYEDGQGQQVQGKFGNWEYTVESSVSLSAKSTVSAQFSQGFTRDTEYPALMMDMREDNTSNLQLNYSGTSLVKDNSQLDASLFVSWVDHLMDNHDRKMSNMMKAETDVQTDTKGYDISLDFPVAYGEWTVGSDATLKSMEGFRDRTMQTGPKQGMTMTDNVWQGGLVNRWGGFAEMRPHVQNWNLVTSVRLDYYYSNATDASSGFDTMFDDLSQDQLNWSASAGIQRDVSSRWTLGLWLGRASRYPGMDELFINYLPIGMDPYEYIGNPSLESETNNQVDFIVGYRSDWFNVKSTVFYSRIQDYITARQRADLEPRKTGTPGVKQFVNVDEAALYGFEASINSAGRMDFGYELTSSWTIGRNIGTHEDLPQIPPLEGNLKLDYRFADGKFVPSIHFRAVAEQDRVSETFGETKTDGFFLTHLRASYRFLEGMTFSGGINNVFDVTYREHLNRSIQGSPLPLNDPGRSFFVELKWDI